LKFEKYIRPLPRTPIAAHRIRGKLADSEFLRVMQQSTVTIGINRVHTPRRSIRNPVAYSTLRDLEAPMMGACYLAEWTEDLRHMYDLSSEIESYRTPEELAEKLAGLAQDPARRRRLRRLGQQRALTELSVPSSLQKIIVALGLAARRTTIARSTMAS